MFKFDDRTTREVDDTRNMVNRKPFRTKEQKEEAKRLARKYDGTWYSPAPYSVREEKENGVVHVVVKRVKVTDDGLVRVA